MIAAPERRVRLRLQHLIAGGGRLAGVQLTSWGKYSTAAVRNGPLLSSTIRGSVGVAPYRVPCEREYLFGAGDCQPANAFSCGSASKCLPRSGIDLRHLIASAK